jgi:hypothetical protein
MSFLFLDAQNKLSVLLQDSNTGTDDAWPLTIRKKELNRGELQFAKDTKCVRNKQTQATTAIASNKLALPTDFLELTALIVNNYVLNTDREIAVQDYDRYKDYGGSYPLYYMSEESGTRYFNFIGVADGVDYTMHYVKKPSTELSGDSDTSILPEEYREAPVYYAAGQLLQQVGKSEYADRYLAIYTKLVRDAQDYSEKMYRSRQYASPDVDAVDGGTTDCQGGGYDMGTW